MKRIMPFLLLLFVTFSCSNSMLDSTDISICFDISQLSDNSVKVARNSTLVTDGKSYNEIKVKVTLYELNGSVDIPTEYSQFDASKYKQITEVQNYANTDGIVSVVLKEIPIGIKSFVVVEIYDEEGASPFYAGLSKVFEVLEGTNVVDIELKKKETSTTYTLTLIYPNNDESTCDYSQGDPASIPSEFPGYNLEGWYDNPDYEGEAISYITVDKNITLYAKGTPIIYNISYILGDDANWITDIYPRTFSVEEVIELPTEDYLAKVGYNFMGWFIDETCTIGITTSDNYYENLTVYAKWTPILYNITYELNDGIWADGFNYEKSYTIESAADLKLPSSDKIIRQGFVFEGWYDNAEYSGTAIKNLAGKTGNITLYAKWRNANQVATVQFSEPAGGVDASTNIILTCDTDNATIYYSYEGKEFSDNWQQDSWFKYTSDATATSEGITIFANGSTNSNPVTIYAIAVCNGMENSDVATIEYTLNEYTVHLDANGGTLNTSVTSTITVKSGNTVSLSGYTATRTGYTFKGWYEDKNPDFTTSGEVREFIPSRDNTTNKSKTFYAGWEPITYTVVFDGNGADASSSMASQNFKYDESKALSQNTFVRTGYTFTGWNTNADGTGQGYSDEETVTNLVSQDNGSITLYAQWVANKASITVTLPEYNEVNNLFSVTKNSDSQVTFTPISEYTHYIWYVNGTEKRQNTSKIDFTISSASYSGGVHTVMLVVEDSNGNYYSQEAIVEITK